MAAEFKTAYPLALMKLPIISGISCVINLIFICRME